jgi:hypothetical protein
MFNKILKSHFSNNPIEHIYTDNFLDLKEFDRLYENQSRLDGDVWKEFKNKHKLDCTFLNDLNDINMQVEVLCLLFFKERADNVKDHDLKIGVMDITKEIKYVQNTLFILPNYLLTFNILTRKKPYIRRPCLQIKLSLKQYNNILGNLK